MAKINDVEKAYKDWLDGLAFDDVFVGASVAYVLEQSDPIRYNVGLGEFEKEKLFQCQECDEYFSNEDDLEDGVCEDCQEVTSLVKEE